MEQKTIDDNVILIGDKAFMNYVTAVMITFTKKEIDKVIIKARGKFTSRAIDVAELSKRLLKNNGMEIECKDIKINSEEFENKEKKKINVSTIEITLSKK